MKILAPSIVSVIVFLAGCGGSSGGGSGNSGGGAGNDCSNAKAETIEEFGEPDRITRRLNPDSFSTVLYNYGGLIDGWTRGFEWGPFISVGCSITDFDKPD